jgi:membrane-bound lytic murein transglycosylase MltF
MRRIRNALAAIALSILGIGFILAQGSRAEDARGSLCLMLESAAKSNDLPLPFLARVIWRESRFDPGAVGPMTRSGRRAEGIAQFMPGTAADRGLDDPFDPVQALPQAAAFLSELRERFGNLGLAAAAYNAGPARVRGWLNGDRTMPEETRAYVSAITGRSVEEWAKEGAVAMVTPKTDCRELVASLQDGSHGFFYELEKRVATALGKPWGVELAAGFSRARVLDLYARAMNKLASLIGGHDPFVTQTLLRSRGTRPLYQAKIGTDSRADANQLCSKIRAAGGACIVMRTPGRRETAKRTGDVMPPPRPATLTGSAPSD